MNLLHQQGLLSLTFVTAAFFLQQDASFKATAGQPEIPFRLVNGNLIVVTGNIGVLEGRNIVLDTGTNPTIISADLAAQLNSRPHEESLTAIDRTLQVKSVILPSVVIGPLHLDSQKGVIQDLSFLRREFGVPIAAIAGLDILSKRSWMIDYDKRKIVFAQAPKAQKSVPFDTRQPFVTVKIELGGRRFRMMVDSGSARLLLYRSRLNSELPKLEPIQVKHDPFLVGAAGQIKAAWYRSYQMKLGKDELGAQTLLVVDADSRLDDLFDGLLGLAQIGFRRVWLDFENGLLAWE